MARQHERERLTPGLACEVRLSHRGFKPLTAIAVVHADLHPNRQSREYQRKHIRRLVRVTFPIREKPFDFPLRDFIRNMWEGTRLCSSLEMLQVLEDLFVRRKQLQQRSRSIVSNGYHLEGIVQILSWVDVLTFGH